MDKEQRRLLDLLLPDSDPRKAYCGIDGLWVLPASHPFNIACQHHDQRYILARAGMYPDSTSENSDMIFFEEIQAIAGDDIVLLAEAHTFHFLCEIWGKFRWPGVSTSAVPVVQKLDQVTGLVAELREHVQQNRPQTLAWGTIDRIEHRLALA